MANCILISGGIDQDIRVPAIHRTLGAYRIASAVESKGYTAFVLDFAINFTPEEICQAIAPHLGSDTLWVGFSSTFFFTQSQADKKDEMYYAPYEQTKPVIDFVKSNSNAKLVYGGAKSPFYTDDDADIDYFVLGYADVSVLALTDYLAGKSTVDPGQVINSINYPEPTMDSLSTSWRNHNILPGEALPIELARGCIFKCKFCSFPLIGKQKGTYLRDAVQVRDEMIEAWETHGTTTYFVTDDTFNDDNDKIDALHKVFTNLPFKPIFSAYLRIDLLNKYPHQADILTDMGLVGTFFGLETMQANSAKAIGKGLAPNKVKDRLYWLADRWKRKVNISAGFILGLPYDDVFYFDDLISWCLESDNPIQQIEFYPLYLFKHTTPGDRTPYLSEFSLHPEIYGYRFPGKENYSHWKLPEQNLNYEICTEIAQSYNKLIRSRNKYASFAMMLFLNVGVTLDDLYDLTVDQIAQKYNISALNNVKLQEYKTMLGVDQLINTKNISKD
jgi:hypothetical protein